MHPEQIGSTAPGLSMKNGHTRQSHPAAGATIARGFTAAVPSAHLGTSRRCSWALAGLGHEVEQLTGEKSQGTGVVARQP